MKIDNFSMKRDFECYDIVKSLHSSSTNTNIDPLIFEMSTDFVCVQFFMSLNDFFQDTIVLDWLEENNSIINDEK